MGEEATVCEEGCNVWLFVFEEFWVELSFSDELGLVELGFFGRCDGFLPPMG